jgi:Zn-finger nucleic acid-binding protein
MATELICPKCQGLMRTYERSGVTVDQCADCRGIFLAGGELARRVHAEQGWQRSHPAPSREREPEHQRYDPRYDDARRSGEGQQKRRKKSFFDELFD